MVITEYTITTGPDRYAWYLHIARAVNILTGPSGGSTHVGKKGFTT